MDSDQRTNQKSFNQSPRRTRHPEYPKADTSAALIQHLSKEIELSTNLLIAQRTKNNLFVAFGPFLVLGGLATNEKAVSSLKSISDSQFLAVAILVLIAYIALGYLAARIEERLWHKCNEWRTEIARISGVNQAAYVFDAGGLRIVYMSIFGALAIVFMMLLWLPYFAPIST